MNHHTDIQRKVTWKDLRHLTIPEMLIENNQTIPWLLASCALARRIDAVLPELEKKPTF